MEGEDYGGIQVIALRPTAATTLSAKSSMKIREAMNIWHGNIA